VQKRRARSYTGGRDQTVDGLAYRHAGGARRAIQIRGEHEIIETVQAQQRERPQMALDKAGLAGSMHRRS
jgi:hypothetical protein